MFRLKINYPVHTLDNQLLFPSGSYLNKETLNELIDSQKENFYNTYPLLIYGSVKEDCLSFLGNPPYKSIFSDKKQVNDIIKILEEINLSIPLLQSMDYFKQYDFYTYAHVIMVFALSTLLAEDMIPDYQDCIKLLGTGPTHDIGKICVPLNILKKNTPLTKKERDFIEHHTVAGYILLSYYYKDIQHLACEVALNHHERKDCSGYPRGILLNNPMIEIIAVSDIYDALIKPRPYRPTAYDNRAALEEITRMAEQNKIGWDGVRALIAHNRRSKANYREIKVSREKRCNPPPHNVYGIIAED